MNLSDIEAGTTHFISIESESGELKVVVKGFEGALKQRSFIRKSAEMKPFNFEKFCTPEEVIDFLNKTIEALGRRISKE